jgi:hypothetical protein
MLRGTIQVTSSALARFHFEITASKQTRVQSQDSVIMHVIEIGSDRLCAELLVTAKLVCIDLILNVLTGLN